MRVRALGTVRVGVARWVIAFCCSWTVTIPASGHRAGTSDVAIADPQQLAPVDPGLQAAQAATSTDEVHATALASFTAYERGLSTRCDLVVPDWDGASLILYGGSPRLSSDGAIATALWVVNVPGTACGQGRTYRIYVQYADGIRSIRAMLPGTGISSPDLDEDSVPSVARAARARLHRRCPMEVTNTRLMGGSSVAEGQPWQEIWTVRYCGRKLSVPIRFTPDDEDDGTTIDIDSRDIMPAN